MKVIRFKVLGKTIVAVSKEEGTYENVEQDLFYDVEHPYSEQMEELAKKEACNGVYTIEDDGQSEPEEGPSLWDVLEAQVTYTAMMTDTLLEV